MHLVRNASEICVPQADGRGIERLRGYALLAEAGRITWIGPEPQIPERAGGAMVHDAGGGAVLPALVDCHTHLVYAGDRIEDFALRAQGASYADIAARGGGILTTVRATRAASTGDLVASTRRRLEHRRRYGIGTTEVKSGYGLTIEHERRLLEATALLRGEGWDLEPTLLAAHAVPPDVPREAYVEAICRELIPEAARRSLASFVDVFVERGAYTLDEGRRVLTAAQDAGLGVRIHADQLTQGGGARLAAELGAASADHLEHATDDDLAAMARSGVIATLLPGAMIFLGDEGRSLGARARAQGVEVAVATDHNPGSSPLHNLPLAATLAVTQMGLTVEEAIRAVTLGAARALRRPDVGTLTVGSRARWAVLDAPDSRALVYAFGEPIVRELVEA
ncbi:MAG: imidazolonepropionase [Deltaproteobacteria bacterium]|nr:imidazolonepropionase [Deltaproteobacteria bacterium]